jgi:hypothetical protein
MRGPFKKRSAAVLVATAASALVAAAPAAAAPDYTTALNASTVEYKWSGGMGKTGFVVLTPAPEELPCKTPGVHDCDHVLVQAEVAGGLTFKTEAADPLAADVDLTLYKSDASGKPGAEVGRGASGTPTSTESVSTNAVAGAYYLLEVDLAVYAGGTYNGVATLKPKAGGSTTPAGGGGAPAADSAPAVGIQRLPSSVKAKSLKGFAGNASDDKGVAKVELALLTVKGKKCTEMTSAKGKFGKANCKAPAFKVAATGTTSWQLKLKKALKKGSYVLYARSVDTAGQKSAVASTKFKVK